MRKKQTQLVSAIVLLICLAQQANARIWRVNKISDYIANNASKYGANVGGTLIKPVFSELTEAVGYGGVINGDTVHLEGCTSGASFSNTDVTKRLIIIGTGYFLTENINVSNDLLPSRIDRIDFIAGSEGSQLIGVWLYSSSGTGGYSSINVSNITIKRCKIDWQINLANLLFDVFLLGNYFDNIEQPTQSSIKVGITAPSNFVIKNNIFRKPVLITSGNTVATVQQCNNNIFDCPSLPLGAPSIKLNALSFQNNILKNAGATVEINSGTGINMTYNTSASASGQFGSAPGTNNIVASNIGTLFANSGSSDGFYQLNPSSSDNVPGSDGTDRGAYGGASIVNRYTLSGLAPIPVIYDISTSGVADATGLPVTIKARTIK
jgi:hypothetical protein